MWRTDTVKGFSTIEIVIAFALFSIIAGAVASATFSVTADVRHASTVQHALELAREGIVAAQSLRDGDMDLTEEGDHGVVFSSGQWQFFGTEDQQGEYVRRVSVTTVDGDTKDIVSDVSWTGKRPGSVTLTGRVTDWRNTFGDSGDIKIDRQAAVIDGDKLSGLVIENIGSSAVTIERMRLTWETPAEIMGITIASTTVFSVATTSASASGELLDTVDHVIPALSGPILLSPLQFTGSMQGSDVTVNVYYSDGSASHWYLAL